MPIPTSRNSVSLSPVGANFRDIDPTRHLDTISEAISTDDSQATSPRRVVSEIMLWKQTEDFGSEPNLSQI